MTTEQRENISRGIKLAAIRKRRSNAMKASWVRRRALNNSTPPVCHTSIEDAIARIESLARLWKVLQLELDSHTHEGSASILEGMIAQARLEIILVVRSTGINLHE